MFNGLDILHHKPYPTTFLIIAIALVHLAWHVRIQRGKSCQNFFLLIGPAGTPTLAKISGNAHAW